jgi:excisionase family DNA binding protein
VSDATAIESALTLDQVAQILNCSARTVRREIDAGRLHSVRFGGRRRVLSDDLRNYIAQHRGDTSVPASNQVTLRRQLLMEQVCLVSCGQRVEGKGGVATFFLDTFSLSHVCPHLQEAFACAEEHLLHDGWQQFTTEPDQMKELMIAREAKTSHLVINVPLSDLHGEVIVYDAVGMPVLDNDGSIFAVVVILVPQHSPWREQFDASATVDFSEPPDTRWRDFFKNPVRTSAATK